MADGQKPAVLIQLTADEHPGVFDAIVAVDSGVDHLLSYSRVEPLDVRDLVHGAMFTRGDADRRRTAIFVGGTSVQAGEQLLRAVLDSFFGTVRVSVMLDANGSNTTAAAAVLCLERHLAVTSRRIAVLAATGAVGSRVAWLLASRGATVRVVSRSQERAEQLCSRLHERGGNLDLEPFGSGGRDAARDSALEGCDGVVAAGAAGISLLGPGELARHPDLQVAIDLNAVPPAGIADIKPTDSAKTYGGLVAYGAIGVGNVKMKIHKAAVRSLFETDDRVLDIDEIYSIGQRLESTR
jgi:hypothetical protein